MSQKPIIGTLTIFMTSSVLLAYYTRPYFPHQIPAMQFGTYTKKLFLIYLKFKFNCVSCVSPGKLNKTRVPIIGFALAVSSAQMLFPDNHVAHTLTSFKSLLKVILSESEKLSPTTTFQPTAPP